MIGPLDLRLRRGRTVTLKLTDLDLCELAPSTEPAARGRAAELGVVAATIRRAIRSVNGEQVTGDALAQFTAREIGRQQARRIPSPA